MKWPRLPSLAVLLLTTWPAWGQSPVAKEAAEAAEALQDSVAGLQAAEGAKDRVAALTKTIRAYEAGLSALREALRQADLRESELTTQFQGKRQEVSQLLGVLANLEADPGPLLLLHPTGPLGTVRSGMILSDVAPALQGQAEALREDLAELRDLRALQSKAEEVLAQGLGVVQEARADLSQAISDRVDLPLRLTDDPAQLAALTTSGRTLADLAGGLAPDLGLEPGFAAQEGLLAWPALGPVILRPGETDASGVTRPGVTLATRPLALVSAPWAATIRYRGPLADYGNVMILEPGEGFLLIMAGLDQVYGEMGEVVSKGAALGLMGGREGQASDILSTKGAGASDSETLYVELRKDGEPIDPMAWFVPEGE